MTSLDQDEKKSRAFGCPLILAEKPDVGLELRNGKIPGFVPSLFPPALVIACTSSSYAKQESGGEHKEGVTDGMLGKQSLFPLSS